jgi:hypothetical protein
MLRRDLLERQGIDFVLERTLACGIYHEEFTVLLNGALLFKSRRS